ncbi:hypothetical protein BDV18DRAFT_164891 [Aspergillus unguis]
MDTEHRQNNDPTAEPSSRSKTSGKFRFKKSHSSSKSSRHDFPYHRDHSSHHGSSSNHRRRHRHDDGSDRRRHKRRRTSPSRSPTPDPLNYGRSLSPDTAFRESLFDALGDDEGAAFWESVYGQPIPAPPGHNTTGGGGGGGDGIDQMDEEEYVAYVRAEMWKRTREGMLEEQERIRAEKRAKARAEKGADEKEERRRFERAMEDSLRRGRERKRDKEVWRGAWESYLKSWEEIEAVRKKGEGDGKREGLRNLLFWPVETGKRRDVTSENVEEFMRRASSHSQPQSSGAGTNDVLLSALKAERIRWHPDKIQHRYGTLGIDETTMRSVTEVFQIVDSMWNDMK